MKKNLRFIFVLLIMVIIFLFSNQNADVSTGVSDSFIKGIFNIFNLNLSITDIITVIVRKSAHFSIYLLLGISVINYIIIYDKKDKNMIIISILICLLYSISDEFHQYFVPGRSMELRDIIIDTMGASVGVFTYLSLYKRVLIDNNKSL